MLVSEHLLVVHIPDSSNGIDALLVLLLQITEISREQYTTPWLCLHPSSLQQRVQY